MNLPPVHPALAHLPIAFVLLSVTADMCARICRRESLRSKFRLVGFASLVAALAGGILTIGTGHLDLHRAALDGAVRRAMDIHRVTGWILGGLLLILTAWRWLIWHRGQMTINTSYLWGGILAVSVTAFQGWYGGEMVYSYGAGVAAAGQGVQSPEDAQKRLVVIQNFLMTETSIGGAESPGGTNSSLDLAPSESATQR